MLLAGIFVAPLHLSAYKGLAIGVITFMDRDPKAEGLLGGKYVTAVKVSRASSSSRLYEIEIGFIDKCDRRRKIFEMELIEDECLKGAQAAK